MAKDSSLEKYELPGRTVTVSLPKNVPESRVRQVKCNNLKIASKITILLQKADIKWNLPALIRSGSCSPGLGKGP